MFHAWFECSGKTCGVSLCEVWQRTHPVMHEEPYPVCAKCGGVMRLINYRREGPQVKPVRKPRFRKGGFKSEQMELFP